MHSLRCYCCLRVCSAAPRVEATRVHENSLRIGRSFFLLSHFPACLGQSICESTGALRRVELSVDGAKNLKLLVFIEPCSGAPVWIQDVIPMNIGWTISRPPTDGAMVDIPDCDQAVQAALQVVVAEDSCASKTTLP